MLIIAWYILLDTFYQDQSLYIYLSIYKMMYLRKGFQHFYLLKKVYPCI